MGYNQKRKLGCHGGQNSGLKTKALRSALLSAISQPGDLGEPLISLGFNFALCNNKGFPNSCLALMFYHYDSIKIN